MKTFGQAPQFLARYDTTVYNRLCSLPEEASYFGEYPTLTTAAQAWGGSTVSTFLALHLNHLAEFAGARDKLMKPQIRQLANSISGEYGYLKVSEVLLFFHRFMMGRYGQFYGVVDPLRITTALREFIEDRRRAYAKREQEEAKARLDAYRNDSDNISREEWERIKAERDRKLCDLVHALSKSNKKEQQERIDTAT